MRFKPCYKWITFNTKGDKWFHVSTLVEVLNLVINGLPSILTTINPHNWSFICVLNLVINGLPSIHTPESEEYNNWKFCFKPCYKWITFNTMWYWISLIDVLYKF